MTSSNPLPAMGLWTGYLVGTDAKVRPLQMAINMDGAAVRGEFSVAGPSGEPGLLTFEGNYSDGVMTLTVALPPGLAREPAKINLRLQFTIFGSSQALYGVAEPSPELQSVQAVRSMPVRAVVMLTRDEPRVGLAADVGPGNWDSPD